MIQEGNQTLEITQQNNLQLQDDENSDVLKYAISKKRERFQVEMRKGKRDEILNRKRVEKMNIMKKSIEEKLKGYHLIYEEQSVIPLVSNVMGQGIDLELRQRMLERWNAINYAEVEESQKFQLEQAILSPSNPEELLVTFKKYRYLILEEKVFCSDIDLSLSEKLLNMLTKLQQYPAIIGMKRLKQKQDRIFYNMRRVFVSQKIFTFFFKISQKYEVVQLLSIISSGNRKQVDSIINISGINIIDNLFCLYNDSMLIQEQLVEVIGNLIADKQINRDLIMKSGVIQKILSSQHQDILYVQTAIWAICNICCMKDFCKFCDLQQFLPIFLNIIRVYPNDKQLVCDSLLSLSILARQAKRLDEIETFCSPEMAQCLVINLQSPVNSIRERALKVLMYISDKMSNEHVANFIFNNKFEQSLINELTLKQYKKEIKSGQSAQQQQQQQFVENPNQMQIIEIQEQIKSNASTRKYTYIAIQNIIYKNDTNITYLLENYSLIKVLVDTLKFEQKPENVLEILYIIESIYYSITHNIIDSLLDSQFIDQLYYILDYQLPDILKIALQMIYDILECLQNQSNNNAMQEDGVFTRHTLENAIEKINDTGVIKKILELQGNRSKDVSETCMDILDKFFPEIQ